MRSGKRKQLIRAQRRLAGLCVFCGHPDPEQHKTGCKLYRTRLTWGMFKDSNRVFGIQYTKSGLGIQKGR